VAENLFEAFGGELRRAIREHGQLLNEEMKRVQEQMRTATEQMRTEMERVGVELQRVMHEFHKERGSSADWYEVTVEADRVEETPKKPRAKSKRKRGGGKKRGS
jgi:hypothetical protein